MLMTAFSFALFVLVNFGLLNSSSMEVLFFILSIISSSSPIVFKLADVLTYLEGG